MKLTKEELCLQQGIQNDFATKGYLSLDSFHALIDLRVGVSTAKAQKIKDYCPEDLLTHLTHCYHEVQHPDPEMNTRIKTYILLGIPWIGMGTVSYLMHLHLPDIYPPIDPETWQSTFQQQKKNFTIKDYLKLIKYHQSAQDS